MNTANDNRVEFEIKEHIGVIANNDSGWKKELNIVSWNGASPKFDIRDWDPDHERMGRGVTLMDGEMRAMVDMYLARAEA